MSKLPLMSVTQPTCCFVHHHQNRRRRSAHLGARHRFPSGQTTWPWIVNSRHQRHHHHQYQYETRSGSSTSWRLLAHSDGGTLTVIVCESASSASSARSGPISTLKASGFFANEKRALPLPSAFSFTGCEESSPSHVFTTILRFCCFRSSAEIADASTGTSSVNPPEPAALSCIGTSRSLDASSLPGSRHAGITAASP